MRRALAVPGRLLVRLPAWLGDCVMAEPLVRACAERATAAHPLTLVGSARIGEALGWRAWPHVNFLALERGQSARVRDWRGHDTALLLDGSWRSAFVAWRAGIGERIGFASGGRALLLTSALTPALERGATVPANGVSAAWPRRLPRPFASSVIELATLVGLDVRARVPRIVSADEVTQRVSARFAAHGITPESPCVLIHAGARANSAKGVPPDLWAAIARGLRERGAPKIVLVCAPGEEAAARAVKQLVPEAVLFDDPPLAIDETVAAHALAAFALAPDGGSRHLAQAAGATPLVVVCGPTDPRHTADHGPRVRIVRTRVECGPCHLETCPISGADAHACMMRIDPTRVVDAAFELWCAPA
ncbi:MAG: glycosyltransferase family 9 protein [Planctomycetes bacterium]|nr:glycosyltransferase family 9 protein [Planctomycetota bacterium]